VRGLDRYRETFHVCGIPEMWKERKWCQKPFLLGLTSGAQLHFLDTRPDGLNFLNLHIHDRLCFFSLPLCPVLTPSIEFFISFNQHSHQGVVWNPFGEVWMFPEIASNSVTSSAFFCSNTFMENLLVETVPGRYPNYR